MVEQQRREGQRLGNYRLERLLGRGGFAEVYIGHHLRLQRPAAIKVLHAYLSEREIEDFQREAQIIAALDHPNIVRILDFDVQQGIPFLVMDYLPNGTLRQRHNKGERVPLLAVVSYVKQIADALQYAHDQRLIHRDVKPENMLIGRRNEVVLSDFGIAAIAHSTSSMTNQASAGTISYMAPEQIQAQARAASDQYALGVVVYEWLCGERPFDGSYTEIFAKHLMAPPPPLRQKIPALSVEVEQVVLTALAKDPRQRFSSIQAFATALQETSQATQKPAGASFEETTLPRYSTPLPPSVSVPPVKHASIDLNTSFAQPFPPTVAATPPAQIPSPTSTPTPAVQTEPSRKRAARKHTRRTVIGLVVVGLATAGGAITWWANRATASYLLYTYTEPSGAVVNAVAWSPNGKRIVSGSDDKTVQVWNAADGRDVYTYRGHTDIVNAVAWSPDGKRIVSGGYDKTVQVWNAADGGNVQAYSWHCSLVKAVAWSPDGKYFASGSGDQTVQIWKAVSGEHVYTYSRHASSVNAVAWSPDSKRIASGSDDQTVQVWDATDGRNAYTYTGHASSLNAVAWSPDGKRIASGSDDKSVGVWNAADGGDVYTYRGHTDIVSSVAWSSDRKHIASGSYDQTVQVWNATNGGNVYTYRGHSSPVGSVAWSPDGRRIASGGGDKSVQVWEPPSR